MSSSHSCSGASTSVGCGWPSVAGRNRSAAYAVGSGGEETCRLLWMRTPQQYRGGLCYTAFWAACVVVLPEGSTGRRGRADLPSGALHHRPARFITVLRQRVGWLVRCTLPFFKSEAMHKACLLLFLRQHNRPIGHRPGRIRLYWSTTESRWEWLAWEWLAWG